MRISFSTILKVILLQDICHTLVYSLVPWEACKSYKTIPFFLHIYFQKMKLVYNVLTFTLDVERTMSKLTFFLSVI